MHYIDVGQGDSTLVELPNGEVSLIDGGPRSNSTNLIKYLKNQNIEQIDYLIATHPHEDHIGGLPEVLRNFKVNKIYMPDKIANTKIFEDLLKEIKDSNLKINIGKAGETLIEEKDLKFYFLAPNKDKYEKTNNYSIVSKIEYGKNSFLITGDAEKESEKEMLSNGFDLKSDILRVGHHGSRTSSTEKFIKDVSADYYIISLGKNNDYNHPHKEVIKVLEATGKPIYRTDDKGTIVVVSDGEKLKFKSHKFDNKSEEASGDNYKELFIGNINTKTFHKEKCGHLPKEENRKVFTSKKEALDAGYSPHSLCIN